MSLMPVAKSNPIVPKINTALTSAIKLLDTKNSSVLPPEADIAQAKTFASEAVSLLSSNAIFPQSNASEALKGAKIGVDNLDRVLNPSSPMAGSPPMPRVRFAQQDISLVEQAANNFEYAINQLNKHHL